MSRQNGAARSDGTAIAMGLVPSRASRPPKGATIFGDRPESAVASPIMPSLAAIRGYAARRPTWLWRKTVQAATLLVLAFSIVNCIALALTWKPKPQCPSMTVVVGDSCTMAHFAPGTMWPALMRSM
jgi:hypothetical protein